MRACAEAMRNPRVQTPRPGDHAADLVNASQKMWPERLYVQPHLVDS